MDSEQALQRLISIQGQAQNDADALLIALNLAKDGYKTDQERIDREIERDKSARQGEIDSLTSQIAVKDAGANELRDTITEKEQKIADLQKAVDDATIIIDDKDSTIISLTSERDDLQRQVESLSKPAEEAPPETPPVETPVPPTEIPVEPSIEPVI